MNPGYDDEPQTYLLLELRCVELDFAAVADFYLALYIVTARGVSEGSKDCEMRRRSLVLMPSRGGRSSLKKAGKHVSQAVTRSPLIRQRCVSSGVDVPGGLIKCQVYFC